MAVKLVCMMNIFNLDRRQDTFYSFRIAIFVPFFTIFQGSMVVNTPDQDETDFTKSLRVMLKEVNERQLEVHFFISVLNRRSYGILFKQVVMFTKMLPKAFHHIEILKIVAKMFEISYEKSVIYLVSTRKYFLHCYHFTFIARESLVIFSLFQQVKSSLLTKNTTELAGR